MKKEKILEELESLQRTLKLYKVEINHWAYDNINDQLKYIIKSVEEIK
jgi:hypothetical protein